MQKDIVSIRHRHEAKAFVWIHTLHNTSNDSWWACVAFACSFGIWITSTACHIARLHVPRLQFAVFKIVLDYVTLLRYLSIDASLHVAEDVISIGTNDEPKPFLWTP